MATLSKHGASRQFEYINHKIAVCEDGNILRNTGTGWKLHSRLKPGVTHAAACAAREAKIAEVANQQPCFAAYKRLMMDWKLADRRAIAMTFDLLGSDLDAVWSELNDLFRISISIDEIQEIHHARNAAAREKSALGL